MDSHLRSRSSDKLILQTPKVNRELGAVRGRRSFTTWGGLGTGWEVFCVVGRRSPLAVSEKRTFCRPL